MLTNVAPTMSSRDLLDIVNQARLAHSEPLVRLNVFNERIKDELDGEDYKIFVVTNPNGTKSEEYQLTLDQCILVGMRESKAVRRNVLGKLKELENNQPKLPQTFAQALKLAYEQQLLIEQQQAQITEMKPKADYCDIILQSKGLVTVTQMAKDYGMSGIKFNQVLADLKIQYKQSGQWQLYQVYADKGYTQSTTHPITHKDGTVTTRLNTKWTQQGRLFLYNKLKEHGILPLIERNPQKQLTI